VSTIGVAVAVPDPWGARLQEYRNDLGDLTAKLIPTHITLVPPFDVEADQIPAIEQHLVAASVINSAFKIHLRGTGTFRPVSPVVFVAVVEGISACEQLALSIHRGPIDIEMRFPFHPHVTVAHHLDDDLLDKAFDEMSSFECDFRVEAFSLYVHDADAGWQPSRHFPLAG
jgi:2'-5' RNA ligase